MTVNHDVAGSSPAGGATKHLQSQVLISLVAKQPLNHEFNTAIPNVRYPAKVTHIAYGICKYAANGEISLYCNMVLIINVKSSISQTNASENARKLKNIMLHVKFNIKLIAYVFNALFFCSVEAEVLL